jgi:hypothetical protein
MRNVAKSMMWRGARTDVHGRGFTFFLATSLGGSLVGERSVAMPSHDARIPKPLVEHDGILLPEGIPSRSIYVVNSERKLSIHLGFLHHGHIIDLATLRIRFLPWVVTAKRADGYG